MAKGGKNLLSRRAAILYGFSMGLFGVLLVRLFNLQLMSKNYYKQLSRNNRTSIRPVFPARGTIADRNDIPMAVSSSHWQLYYVIASGNLKLKDMIERLEKLITLSAEEKNLIYKNARKTPKNQPLIIKQDMQWEEVLRIQNYLLDLQGVLVESTILRHYPHKDQTPLCIGYVGLASSKEKGGQHPDLPIGKSGLEQTFNSSLIGEIGIIQNEVDVKGYITKSLEAIKPKEGNPLQTTVDFNLHKHIYDYMVKQGSVGSSVVLNIQNGDILALTSTPSIDPNIFLRPISQNVWAELMSNPHAPLANKPLVGQYAPGSIIKPIFGAVALQNKLITPETTCVCNGSFTFGNRKFHCWNRKGHGVMNLHSAIVQSCDTYFYTIAAKDLDMNSMIYAASSFGLGQKYLHEIFPTEAEGIIPTPTWKFITRDETWEAGETIISSIGQGYWLFTPLQMAVMVGRIASGKRIKANIIQGQEETEQPPMPYDDSILQAIRKSMADTVSYGTGYSAFIGKDYAMAGKTGTVQVRGISAKERETGVRKNHELPWELRDHSLFVGFLPYDNPKYAIAIVLEHAGNGSTAAAPLARVIGQYLKNQNRI